MAANKMSFKLKGNKGRKPSSPGSMSGGTPTNSQSSMGGVSERHESSIDDPLVNAEIKALGISEDNLREANPIAKPNTPNEIQVLIKDTPPSPRSPIIKDVAVLHPLPPRVKMSKMKLLGSLKGGPRCDEDNIMISHSIIGTVEDYTESRLADRQATGTIPSTLPPPISIPSQTSFNKKSPPKERYKSRETNALANWDKKMNERKKLQDKIARRIRGERENLTMNQGDTYRRIQEERSFIDRAIPKIDSGKGYHVGSEFWKLHSTVGDELTGIKTTLTKTERGEPPVVDFISCPHSNSDKNDMFMRWSRSQYLKKRKDELTRVVSEPQYPTDVQLLQVTGLVPSSPLPTHSHAHRPLSSSMSLDSLGQEEEEEEGTLSETSFDDEEGEERDGRDTINGKDSIVRSTSLLASHPDVVTPPIIGPALLINEQLLTWELEREGERHQEERIETRVLFETGVKELSKRNITLTNTGTVVIRYTWKQLPRYNPFGTRLSQDTQRFYFDTKGGIILPGREVCVDYVFKSPNIGIYSEEWELVTTPILSGGRQIVVTLKGVAFQPDLYKEKRQEIELSLRHDIAQRISRTIVEEILDNVQTPPPLRSSSPLPLIIPEEAEFVAKNPGVFYRYNEVQSLKALYHSVHTQEATPPNDTGQGSNIKGRKLSEDKTIKKGGGGGGKKESLPIKKLPSQDSRKELPVELGVEPSIDIPPWDLSLVTLEKMILEISDHDSRESKLSEFNSIISELNKPLPSIPRSTNYIKTYFILSEAVDQLVSTSEQLHQTMGIPLSKNTAGLNEEDSQADLDQPPSQPTSPAIVVPQMSKKDQSKKGSKKDAVKDVARPSSKKGMVGGGGGRKDSKKPAKGGGKGTKTLEHEPSRENLGPIATKPSEVNPSLLLKYNEIFQTLAHNIMVSAIDEMSVLLEEND